MDCPPPGPENEAGRPNSYGQPKVQQRMRIINDDYGADDYNSHGSNHDNDDADIVLSMLNYWLAPSKTELAILPDLA